MELGDIEAGRLLVTEKGISYIRLMMVVTVADI